MILYSLFYLYRNRESVSGRISFVIKLKVDNDVSHFITLTSPLANMESMSSSVISESFEENTWLAPCLIMFNISSLFSWFFVSTNLPDCITNLSNRSLTSARSTIFSSTVFSVIRRNTRT